MADRPNFLSSKKTRPWRDIAAELRIEEDPEKILTLATELNDAMVEEERLRVQDRMERNPPAEEPPQ